MTTYLITGVSGFVGKYLVEHLRKLYPNSKIIGLDRAIPADRGCLVGLSSFEAFDLLDVDASRRIIENTKPDFIVHLASFSSVSYSWKEPANSFLNNTNIFLNLLEAVRGSSPHTRVLSIGSSEEYGAVREEDVPLNEERPLNPTSPYGVARVSQEQLSRVYSDGFGLDIILTRSFNHIGPGQRDAFVVSSFVKQFVVAMLAGKDSFNLVTGDINIIRDFTDVRDVVVAYDLLLQRAKKNQLYNVCSGKGYSLFEIISMLVGITGVKATVTVDPVRIRPSENPIIVGDNRKIKTTCGWYPNHDIILTLKDMVSHWRNHMQDSNASASG